MDRAGQCDFRRRNEFGMEGAGNRQRHRAQPGRFKTFGCACQCRLRPGDHALLRRVVIGNTDAVEIGNVLEHLVAPGLHRNHAPWHGHRRGVRHRATPFGRQAHEIRRFKHTGSEQRGVLTVAVACRCNRAQADALGKAQVTERQCANCRLRVARVGDRQRLLLFGLCIEGGWRIHPHTQAFRQLVGEGVFGELQCAAHLFEIQRCLTAHVDVLRPLAREQEGDGRCCGRQRTIDADMWRQWARCVLCATQVFDCGCQIFLQRREIGSDDGHRDRRAALLIGVAREGLREFAGLQRTIARERIDLALQRYAQRFGIGPAEYEQLARPAAGTRRCALSTVLLEYRVEIRSAEAEGGGRTAARMILRRQPGPRVFQQIDRCIRIADHIDRLFDTGMAGQHAMMQCECNLDQTRRTGRSLGVPEQGLDRTDRRAARCCAAFQQRARNGLRLGAIANRRAGAMRFNEIQRCGREAGLGVGAIQCADLTFNARRGQTQCLAVAGTGGGLDDRIDAVAIAFCVFEPFECNHCHAFGDRDAVGVLIEGARLAADRQRLGLGKRSEGVSRLRRVEAAGEHEIAAAGFEFVDGEADRGERGAASRIDDEVHAAEIETIRHATGGDIEQGAGEGLFSPLGKAVPDLG